MEKSELELLLNNNDYKSILFNLNKEILLLKKKNNFNNNTKSSFLSLLSNNIFISIIVKAITVLFSLSKKLDYLSNMISNYYTEYKNKINKLPRLIELNSIKKLKEKKVIKLDANNWCKSLCVLSVEVNNAFHNNHSNMISDTNTISQSNIHKSFNTVNIPSSFFNKASSPNINYSNTKSRNTRKIVEYIITGHDSGEISIWNIKDNSKLISNTSEYSLPIFALTQINSETNFKKANTAYFCSSDYLKNSSKGKTILWQFNLDYYSDYNSNSTLKCYLTKIKTIYLENEGVWCISQIYICDNQNKNIKEDSNATPDTDKNESLNALTSLIFGKSYSNTSNCNTNTSINSNNGNYFDINLGSSTNIINDCKDTNNNYFYFSVLAGTLTGNIILWEYSTNTEILSNLNSNNMTSKEFEINNNCKTPTITDNNNFSIYNKINVNHSSSVRSIIQLSNRINKSNNSSSTNNKRFVISASKDNTISSYLLSKEKQVNQNPEKKILTNTKHMNNEYNENLDYYIKISHKFNYNTEHTGGILSIVEINPEKISNINDGVDDKSNTKYFVTTGNDTYIKLWKLNEYNSVYTIMNHSDSVTSLSYNSYYNAIISFGLDSKISIYDLEDQQVIINFDVYDKISKGVILKSNSADLFENYNDKYSRGGDSSYNSNSFTFVCINNTSQFIYIIKYSE